MDDEEKRQYRKEADRRYYERNSFLGNDGRRHTYLPAGVAPREYPNGDYTPVIDAYLAYDAGVLTRGKRLPNGARQKKSYVAAANVRAAYKEARAKALEARYHIPRIPCDAAADGAEQPQD